MNAVVVYESHWGNTEAVARAIAEGLSRGARALTTSDATPDMLADVDLIVAGAPVLGFRLPTEAMLASIRADATGAPTQPDLEHPSMRTWLEGLPAGNGLATAFETRVWWSPGGATGAVMRALRSAGYKEAAKPRRFVVRGRYGPLRDGELDRAREWGSELARLSA